VYFVQYGWAWTIVPDSIGNSDLSGYAIAGQWLTVDMSQIQPGTAHLVVGADGTLYLLQGTSGWSLIVSPMSDDDIASFQPGAELSPMLQFEFFQNPTSFLANPPAVAPPEAEVGPPATLTGSVRQDIVNAVVNYNGHWQQALSMVDASRLSNAATSQELTDDIAEINKLKAAGRSKKLYQNAFNVTDVTIEAPGHATVRTTETWSGEIDSLSTGQLVQRLPPTNYVETYTVEFQNGGWIVTLDQLQQV
jgi:hypothetical protein